MMKRISIAAVAFAALAVTGSRLGAEETVKAGLQPGDRIGPFNVKEVAGPDEKTVGTSFCYTCKYGTKPVVNVFVTKVDKNVATLLKGLDEQLQKDNALRGYVVLLTEDEDSAEAKLKDLWKAEGLKKLPLTVFGTMAGPPAYKINKKAVVSVHMWNKQKVKNSFAFKSTEDVGADKVKEIVAAAKKLTAPEGVASN